MREDEHTVHAREERDGGQGEDVICFIPTSLLSVAVHPGTLEGLVAACVMGVRREGGVIVTRNATDAGSKHSPRV